MVQYFTLKLKYWRRLPWCLAGLAHHDVVKAKACARRALALAANHVGPVHWLVALILIPGTICYDQVLLFINGTPLEQLPALMVWLAMLRSIKISERWIESRHALIKRAFAGIHAGAITHMNFITSLPMIEHLLEAVDAGISALARHYEGLRNPFLVLKEMGFLTHPAIREILDATFHRKTCLHHKKRKHIIQIVYHCDTRSLFQPLPCVYEDEDDNDDDDGGGPGGPGGRSELAGAGLGGASGGGGGRGGDDGPPPPPFGGDAPPSDGLSDDRSSSSGGPAGFVQ